MDASFVATRHRNLGTSDAVGLQIFRPMVDLHTATDPLRYRLFSKPLAAHNIITKRVMPSAVI